MPGGEKAAEMWWFLGEAHLVINRANRFRSFGEVSSGHRADIDKTEGN